MKKKILNPSLFSLIGLAFLAGVSGVQAATIQIGGGGAGTIYLEYDDSNGATVQGYTGAAAPYLLNNAQASFYDVNSSLANEAAYLNLLTGNATAFVAGDVYKMDDGEDNGMGGVFDLKSFEISTEYFAIKQGSFPNPNSSNPREGGTAFFKVTSGLPITFSVYSDSALEKPLNVSHVSQFGTPVPLPAAAYLFGSALLGIAGIGYRRNKKQA